MNRPRPFSLMLAAALIVLAIAPMHASASLSTAESNLAIATQYFGDLWGKGDVGGSHAIVADDFQRVDRSNPDHPLGKAGTLFLADYLHRAFSNVTFTIDQAIADGDTIAISWQTSGTHDGTYGYLPATHKAVTWTGMSFLTVENGSVVQEVTNLENLSALLGDTGEVRLSPSYAQ